MTNYLYPSKNVPCEKRAAVYERALHQIIYAGINISDDAEAANEMWQIAKKALGVDKEHFNAKEN